MSIANEKKEKERRKKNNIVFMTHPLKKVLLVFRVNNHLHRNKTATQEIQRIIELDGWTHRKDSEAEADKFKDEACREAGLKIIRIDYQEMNYPETMLQKIVEG